MATWEDLIRTYRPTGEVRRQLGDQWDETKGGVRLPPIEMGTLVEVYDRQAEWLVLGKVTARTQRVDVPETLYTVVTQLGSAMQVGRSEMSVPDLNSPEGIDDFLNGDNRPQTAEEVIRFLEGEGDA
jgi:hypothetical protein